MIGRMARLGRVIMGAVAVGMIGRIEAAEMPARVVLANGHEFRAIAVVRWLSDGVVIKHPGGADPFRWAYMRADSVKAWQEYYAAIEKEAEVLADTRPAAAAEVNGQCFITTKGAGAYKLSGMKVWIFPAGTEANFQTSSHTIFLPKPLASRVTDADGWFDFKAADFPCVIVAQGARVVGRYAEEYEWVLVVKKAGRFDLNGQNLTSESRHDLRIAE